MKKLLTTMGIAVCLGAAFLNKIIAQQLNINQLTLPIMKRVFITIIAAISCSGAFAQNILADSGDVYIKANLTVDSSGSFGSLGIRESLSVHGSTSVSGEFVTEGPAHLRMT